MQISSGVSNPCLYAPAPYYELNKGFFLGFPLKPLGGLRPPHSLNKKASEKYPLSLTCISPITTSLVYYKSMSFSNRKCNAII